MTTSWPGCLGSLPAFSAALYGMNGPPLVIYGALRRWTPEFFRATLQGYFLPASLASMVGYSLRGHWVADVTRYYLFSLPVVLAAIFLGRVIHRRLKDRRFLTYIHVGLILLGISLLIQAAWLTHAEVGPHEPMKIKEPTDGAHGHVLHKLRT